MLFSFIWIKRKMDTTAQSHLLGRGFSLHHHVHLSWFSTSVRLQAVFYRCSCSHSGPQKPPSLVRQHRVIGTRPDGDSATRLVYFLAACIQLQPLFVCRTSDALPIMGSSNARSPSVARPVWLRSSALSTGQPGRKSSVLTWTHPTSVVVGGRGGTSEGQAKVARRPENEVKTTRLQSPAGYLKRQKMELQ